MNWLLQNEPLVRIGSFLGVLAILSIAEAWRPRRHASHSLRRTVANAGLLVFATICARILIPLLPVGAALYVARHEVGLMNLIEMPDVIAFALTLIALDIAIYWQHRLMHAVPWLWRLHRVHHSDTGFDVTTALRFHPIEILISLLFKIALIVALGAPAAAVLVFEIVLNAAAMFNHSNLALSDRSDRRLRWLLVTPDMHRIHHSVRVDETNSNFGFSVPWWDRLFGSYRHTPVDEQETMPIGLDKFRSPQEQHLAALIVQPVQK
ncbi:MAG: sterol desaturase family protein [Pseudomonadota bacterium]